MPQRPRGTFVLLMTLFVFNFTSCGWTEGIHNELTDPKVIEEAELIFVGKIVQVEPSPGFWSGGFPAYQRVHYTIKELLKGQFNEQSLTDLVVAYLIVKGAKWVTEHPELNPEYFHVGRELLVFARWQTRGRGNPVYEALDTIEAALENVEMVKATLKADIEQAQ